MKVILRAALALPLLASVMVAQDVPDTGQGSAYQVDQQAVDNVLQIHQFLLQFENPSATKLAHIYVDMQNAALAGDAQKYRALTKTFKSLQEALPADVSQQLSDYVDSLPMPARTGRSGKAGDAGRPLSQAGREEICAVFCTGGSCSGTGTCSCVMGMPVCTSVACVPASSGRGMAALVTAIVVIAAACARRLM